ncbi:hypothetical protein [Shewanella surugensis]|uniref:Phosphoglyceromutase n=1 Tax=Shewanella surugensis TaxID=212020 RepID=A0ABT0L6Z3_9GAMM|nr:hypothetical protein [Shewanella surugensis]MCL1123458.1 hypothetical protein [Shewanella surugensis]
MTKVVFLLTLLLTPLSVFSSPFSSQTPNLVLVTIDGLRWTEVLDGANLNLINSPHWVLDTQKIERDFWNENRQVRRENLMPFLWQQMVPAGVLIGKRNDLIRAPETERCVRNDDFYQSLSPEVDSMTLWTQRPDQNKSKLLAWLYNTFPPVGELDPLGAMQQYNFFEKPVKKQISPWPKTRFDSMTYRYAKQSLFLKYQKVTYVSFGATDMYLHEGEYGQYLYAARRIDGYVKGLWTLLQALPQYRNNTILVVVNGHTLKRISSQVTEKTINGYYPMWFAAMGPGIHSVGELGVNFPLTQTQISEMLLMLLKENPGIIPSKARVLLREFTS